MACPPPSLIFLNYSSFIYTYDDYRYYYRSNELNRLATNHSPSTTKTFAMQRTSFSFLVVLCFVALRVGAQTSPQTELSNAAFTIKTSRYGLGELRRTGDVHPTNYIRNGRVFGDVTVRYAVERKVDSVKAASASKTVFIKNGTKLGEWIADSISKKALQIAQSFSLEGDAVLWQLQLSNTGNTTIRVEDLVIPLSYNAGGGENPLEIFEQRVVKHHFISGNNSFIFFQRPTGLGPYLLMIPLPGTSLEYFSTAGNAPGERGFFQAFIHSSLSGNKELRGTWRQPHTTAFIPAKASKGYGFKLKWAADYNGIRDILAAEGLIDVQVAPGMSLPSDLDANIALRTKEKIGAVVPEFAAATRITYLGEKKKGTHLYRVRFSRLGENKLTINYGNGYKTYLEFFVTEPLETLYKKRSAFITTRQQHKLPGKWYDGLYGVYDMKNAALRGPDDPDFFDTSRLSYVLTCDDPGLCKAPFVAAKNVFYPDQKEIESVEYYIKNFVWGGLQRTDKETPYPYGVYGTPNWYVNRDTARRRRNTADRNQDRMHVWRSYDYPHIMMMYYHLYQVAKAHPGMTKYLDAKGYLVRAKETAKAYFKYPYEILPWYEIYKWGCYNELLLTDLIADLRKEGYPEDADFLRAEWEKKVKYFVYDDKYPFRSEYAIDATAFESSHALAKYATLTAMQPDSNLWYDKNSKKSYSHPVVRREDGRAFMDRQLQANMALRGVIEPAYYFLGSDFRGRSDGYTLSYMSQMGGWSILDYALHFATNPPDYIRLGYQSYLSSFALINSGTPGSNYGYWYPGKENDGATGWAFEPQKYATPWIQKPQGRGPWFYDGEIDLGFGGATRMAATVATNDPVFGMMAYGGDLVITGNHFSTVPKDGLRRRFYYRNGGQKFDIELHRDGFARDKAIVFDGAGQSIRFLLENRSADAHATSIALKGLQGLYDILANGKAQRVKLEADGSTVNVAVPAKGTTVVLKKVSE